MAPQGWGTAAGGTSPRHQAGFLGGAADAGAVSTGHGGVEASLCVLGTGAMPGTRRAS